MHPINAVAIIVSTVLAFVLSAVWYAIFSKARAKLSEAAAAALKRPPVWQVLVELAKNLIIATIIAMFISHIGVGTGLGSVPFALLLWIGFPLMILISSVMYENVPKKLAAIHSGDWLVKLVIMSVIIGNWR